MKYIPPYKFSQSSSIRTNNERVGAAANEKLALLGTGLAVQGFQCCSREKYFLIASPDIESPVKIGEAQSSKDLSFSEERIFQTGFVSDAQNWLACKQTCISHIIISISHGAV